MSIQLPLADAAGQPVHRLSVDSSESGTFMFAVVALDGTSTKQEVSAQDLRSVRDLPMGWTIRLGSIDIHHGETDGVVKVGEEQAFVPWETMRHELSQLPLARLF